MSSLSTMNVLVAMRRTHAFTLIETLVVIAVILILAAIVLPVILGGKRSAKIATDASNLRQIGQAAAIYAASNDDIMPLTVYPLVDSGTIRNTDILRSPNDTTKFGLGYELAVQMQISDLQRSDHYVSYTGVRHYALDRAFFNDAILGSENPGWLVNVTTATFTNEHYVRGLGKYQRLLIDGSVQTRHMDYVDAYLPGKEETTKVFFGGMYFVDEGPEWVASHS